MKRTGSLRGRLALRALRLSVVVWRVGERLGIDVAGATEGPPYTIDGDRRRAFDSLLAAAQDADGRVNLAACPYPIHDLLTYLVVERGFLLHGSNDTGLEALEPRTAHDFGTELTAVVAADDGIWPIFYATAARDRLAGVFTACTRLGRPPRLRRFYMFVVFSKADGESRWTDGAIYVLPPDGFRREWGHEWVRAERVRPLLRVPVTPEDFPLRDVVLELSTEDGTGRLIPRLRAAKRERAARGSSSQ